MSFWAVTRVENGRQTYLYLDDNEYGLAEGGSHPWEASYCIHMASGHGPSVAPDAQAVPVYAAAPVNASAQIGAYAGTRIDEPDGTLFGAICGLDLSPRTDDYVLTGVEPLLRLLGQLITMVLAAERGRTEARRHAFAAAKDAETDPLTGLLNRRAWQRLLDEEACSFRQLADPTVIVMTDLDRLKTINDTLGHEAGDDYLRRASRALRSALRSDDVVARLGGDEFGILLRGCEESVAVELVRLICEAMDTAGVATSVGWAPITVVRGLPAALAAADAAMYEAKRLRRSARAR